MSDYYKNIGVGSSEHTGLGKSSITYNSTIPPYIKYNNMTNMNIVNGNTAKQLSEMDEVKNMSEFPNQGSIKIINGTVIVKLSNKFNPTTFY